MAVSTLASLPTLLAHGWQQRRNHFTIVDRPAQTAAERRPNQLDSHLERRARTLAWVGLVVASALVLVADFPWGDLQDHSHWSKIRWIPFVSPPLKLGDIALHTLLCAPIGGLSGRLFRRPLLMAFGLSLSLSVTAEWSQVYSHTRYPSATDVTCNVAGAVLAAALSRRLDSEPRTLR